MSFFFQLLNDVVELEDLLLHVVGEDIVVFDLEFCRGRQVAAVWENHFFDRLQSYVFVRVELSLLPVEDQAWHCLLNQFAATGLAFYVAAELKLEFLIDDSLAQIGRVAQNYGHLSL